MNHTEHDKGPEQGAPLPQAKLMRVADVDRVYRFKRSFLYDLVKQGRISSIVIKGRSKARGIRLFNRDELDEIVRESTVPPKS